MSLHPVPKPTFQPIVQCELSSGDKRMVTWLDKSPSLKEGVLITLKDYETDEDWKVVKIYSYVGSARDFDWQRKWTNNI